MFEISPRADSAHYYVKVKPIRLKCLKRKQMEKKKNVRE